MYSSKPSIVYGFHGLDYDVAMSILANKENFKHSKNDYDWLGTGVYFWENNLERAKQWADEQSKRPETKVKNPFVLGAIIDLGNCLDLLDQRHLDFLEFAYKELEKSLKDEGKELPKNGVFGKNDFDFKKRVLDCAVIRFAHELAKKEKNPFDSVRAVFWEGEALYPDAGIRRQNHIQLAIVNPNCIKGIFLPREKISYSD